MTYFQADNLRALAERENNNSRTQDAFAAASAYSSIVQEIADAGKAADEAELADKKATEAVSNICYRTKYQKSKSGSLTQLIARQIQ